MYKVLIVDDEFPIRRGLKTVIDWESFGFSICGEAESGGAAIEMIRECKPDVIFADVKMPGINGLELVDYLRRNNFDCRVVIITGYSEFEYAHTAIHLGVDAYLLKPVEEQELKSALEKVKAELRSHRNAEERLFRVPGHIVSSIVQNQIAVSMIDDYNAIYSFGFPWRSYQVVLTAPKNMGDCKAWQTIADDIAEYVLKKKLGYCFISNMYAGILCKNSSYSAQNPGVLLHMSEMMQKKYNTEILISVGESVTDIVKLNDSFSSALRLQEDRFKSSVCIVSPDVNQTGNCAMGGDYLISLSQQLSVAITTGNQEYVKEILHGFYAGLAASTYSSQEIQSLYTLLYMNLAESIRLASGIDLDKQKEILSDMLNCADLKRLNDYFTTVMTRLCNSLKVNGPNNIISTLVCYIDNNYPKRITLASVSKVFGYNSRYLGRIFKKHTGKTFNQYLEGIRVKHAKELLDSGDKINEIARKVGFTDVNYFYLIFRQSEGCAPTEYRKKN